MNRAKKENIAIVLNEPRYPENIGAAARAMKNMGFNELIVIKPYIFNREKIEKMATHEAHDIIESMQLFENLEDALAPFNYVVGTTARTGKLRRPQGTPRNMANHLIPISQNNKIALLFGSERWGLTNSDLKFCDYVVTIPTDGFATLNLAQSVMILCYEIAMAGRKERIFHPKRASVHELENMYDHLQQVFLEIGFLKPDNPDFWMRNVRSLFGRIGLLSKEVQLIRGLCRQFLWYVANNMNKSDKKHKGTPTNQP